MADIFLSYQKNDRDLAERMAAALRSEGFSVWWDDDITPRESWDRTIEREIAMAEHVLVLWTKNSVESRWVRTEATYANRCQPSKLVQACFDGVEVPLAFTLSQFIVMPTRWRAGPGWRRLLLWLREEKEVGEISRSRTDAKCVADRTDEPQNTSNGHAFFGSRAFMLLAIGLVTGGALCLPLLYDQGNMAQPNVTLISVLAPFMFGLPIALSGWHTPFRWRLLFYFVILIPISGFVAYIAAILVPLGLFGGALIDDGFLPALLLAGAIGGAVGPLLCIALGRWFRILVKNGSPSPLARRYLLGLSTLGALVGLAGSPLLTGGVEPAEQVAMVIAVALWLLAFAFALSRQIGDFGGLKSSGVDSL